MSYLLVVGFRILGDLQPLSTATAYINRATFSQPGNAEVAEERHRISEWEAAREMEVAQERREVLGWIIFWMVYICACSWIPFRVAWESWYS